MFTKLYAEIKKIVSENWKMLCAFVFGAALAVFPLPYYIDTPGGAIDISKKIEVSNAYPAQGSLNFAYVSELKATTITYLLSFFNKEWKVMKKSDVVYDNETIKDMEFRDHLSLEESNDNATLVAYQKLGKKVKIKEEHTYITYIDEKAKTDVEVGEEVLQINGEKIENKDDFLIKIKKHKVGDSISLLVKKENKEIHRSATLIDNNGTPAIGILVGTDVSLETSPALSIQKEENESGPSGGLMLALAIYNSLTEEDITKGKKIVGTGTIDREGNVGSIGGVEFKLKGAVKEKADLFLVPAGKNYEEAMKIKKERKYSIPIKAIETFDEALIYLRSL